MVWEPRSQYWLFLAYACPYELIFHLQTEEDRGYPFYFIKKDNYTKIILINLIVKIVDFTVELYFKGKNLNSKFFSILFEINDFSIK